MTDLGTLLSGSWAYAEAINVNGEDVGLASTSYSWPYTSAPFVYSGGVMTNLNDLIPRLRLDATRCQSHKRQRLDRWSGHHPSGQYDAVLLTRVPEPCAFALFGTAAIGLFGWAWRRRDARNRERN